MRWRCYLESSSIHSRTSQAGHKYLFSDELHSWEEARAECALYGGWLVNIGGVREQNCLVRFVDSRGWAAKYWTDGSSEKLYPESSVSQYCSSRGDTRRVDPRLRLLRGDLVQPQVYV